MSGSSEKLLHAQEAERRERFREHPVNRPLALRLRDEAKEWEDDESVKVLLVEAAEAIETMAAVIAAGDAT